MAQVAAAAVAQGEQDDVGRLWNAEYVKVLVANALMYIPVMMLNVVLGKYVDSLNGGAAAIGVATGIFSVTAFVGYLVAGPVIDAVNRRYVLAGSLVVMGVAIAGYSVVGQVLPVIGFRLLQGLGLAFATTCFLVVATNTVPRAKLASGIWYFTLVHTVCQAVGPVVGLALIPVIGYRGLFAMDAVLMVLGAGTALTLKNTRPARTGPVRLRVTNPIAREAVLGGVLLLLITTSYFVVNSFLAVFAKDRGVTGNIGYFFTVYAITLVAASPLVSWLADRVGTVRVLVVASVFFAAALLVTSVGDSVRTFLFAGFLLALGYGVASPVIKALIMKVATVGRRGAASATANIGTDLGTLVGPLAGGFVVERFGYVAMWRLMLLPIAIALVLVVLCRRRIARAEDEARPDASPRRHEGLGAEV